MTTTPLQVGKDYVTNIYSLFRVDNGSLTSLRACDQAVHHHHHHRILNRI